MGLPLLIQTCYILERRERLDVIAPAESISGLKRLLNLTYLFPHKLGFEVELHPLSKRFAFEMKGLQVTPIANQHLRGHEKFLRSARLANTMECYSFSILSNGNKVIYSADLGSLSDLEPVLADTDLLVIEAMHIDLSQLGILGRVNRVRKILLTHLPEAFDLRAAKPELARQANCRVSRAREGMCISFDPAAASRVQRSRR